MHPYKRKSSYSLLNDDLINEAVTMESGKDAKLKGWKIEDFARKGGNYISIVTSVVVKVNLKENDIVRSYIAKLNPLGPVSEFTELMSNFYARDAIVLSSVMPALNEQLIRLHFNPLRTPQILSFRTEFRKEVLLMEDMRKQDFQLFSRFKGMDWSHASLVVQALARFHASSLLVENQIEKKIENVFEHMREDWLHGDHPVLEIFRKIYAGHSDNTCQLLEGNPQYKKSYKWLAMKREKLGDMYIRLFLPSHPMEVLSHGDCWSQNMLFRYDENEQPVELCLLDFQTVRKASPVIDLLNFFYSSLGGVTRSKIRDNLVQRYYEEFSKILKKGRIDPPFTLQDLQDELKRKLVFGMISGIKYLPLIFAEGEHIVDITLVNRENVDEFVKKQKQSFDSLLRKQEFRERLLSVIDDMEAANVFDNLL